MNDPWIKVRIVLAAPGAVEGIGGQKAVNLVLQDALIRAAKVVGIIPLQNGTRLILQGAPMMDVANNAPDIIGQIGASEVRRAEPYANGHGDRVDPPRSIETP